MHHAFLRRIFVFLILFASIVSAQLVHAGVWGDRWGDFLWGPNVVQITHGLNLYAPTEEMDGTVTSCYDLLEFLGGDAALESIASIVTATQQTTQCMYDAGVPSGNDFPLLLGSAYLVRLKQQRELAFGPAPTCPATTLGAGVNLLGVGKPPAAMGCFDVITRFAVGVVSAVQRFDTERGTFETCALADTGSIVGSNFPIVPGQGYVVHATSAAAPVNLNDLTHAVCNP